MQNARAILLTVLCFGVPLMAAPPPDWKEADAILEAARNGDERTIPFGIKWLNDPNLSSYGATIVGLYQLRAREPDLIRAYLAAKPLPPGFAGGSRGNIANALIDIANDKSKPLIQKMVDDKSHDMTTRSKAALWLWKRGDAAKRQWLLDRYADYLVDISTKNGWDPGVREVLDDLGVDEDLIRDIQAMDARQTHQRARNNIRTLIEDMRRNDAPLDGFVANLTSANWHDRCHAIVQVGRRGGQDLLDDLAGIPEWRGNETEPEAFTMHQKKLIAEASGRIRVRAVVARMEAAQKPPAKPATRPATRPTTHPVK